MTVAPHRSVAGSQAEQRRAAQQAHRDRVAAAMAETEPSPFDNPLERLVRARRRRAAEELELRVPVVRPDSVPSPRRPSGEARGAERVQTILDRLGDGWWVLDAVAVGDRGTVIDHLVIGPGGVFTVAAHHHDGCSVHVEGDTVVVDGQRQPHVRGSEHAARRAARLLTAAVGRPVRVTGVLAVVADRVTVRSQPTGVVAVEGRSVPRFLGRQHAALTTAEVTAVVAAARRRATWQAARPGR